MIHSTQDKYSVLNTNKHGPLLVATCPILYYVSIIKLVNSSEKNNLKGWKACCCGDSTLVALPSSHHDVAFHPPVGAPAVESRVVYMHTHSGSIMLLNYCGYGAYLFLTSQ